MDRFIIDEWILYANTDISAAKHLRDTMHPKNCSTNVIASIFIPHNHAIRLVWNLPRK